ncbi:hypothetical protein MINTM001_03860 [Mycobacterium paraintracellulare]|nr:hypothetical protein MINTM001_03860 [Mycobacterium paraintracellulare]
MVEAADKRAELFLFGGEGHEPPQQFLLDHSRLSRTTNANLVHHIVETRSALGDEMDFRSTEDHEALRWSLSRVLDEAQGQATVRREAVARTLAA